MPLFKFTFANNAILSNREIPENLQLGDYYVEQYKGTLIYIIVRADSEEEAKIIALRIASDFLK